MRLVCQEQLVEFNQLAIEHANGHEDMLNRVMTKDNIALAALLQTKEACWENGVPPDHKVVLPRPSFMPNDIRNQNGLFSVNHRRTFVFLVVTLANGIGLKLYCKSKSVVLEVDFGIGSNNKMA